MNTAARRVTAAQEVTIHTVARMMLDEAKGDINAATTKLVNYVSNLPRLHDDLLQFGARQLLHSLPSSQRAAISAARVKQPYVMPAGARRAQEQFRAASATLRSAIFNEELTINNQVRKLADWTGSEILAHAEANLAKGASAVRNARFLISVAQRAGNKRVGDAIDDATIERLKAEAERSVV